VTAAVTRMFATCLPGLAPLVRQQLDRLPGITPTGSGFDGVGGLAPASLTPAGQFGVRLLGRPATIWCFRQK
jgi:hypothetical protein